jgi:hypothetical protein
MANKRFEHTEGCQFHFESMPCALRDTACAVVNFMMIDNYDQDQSSIIPHIMNIDDQLTSNTHGENNTDTESASSRQFLISLQAHEGECAAASASKSTAGSPSSTEFNGSISLYQKNGNQTAFGSAVAWTQRCDTRWSVMFE